MPKQKKKNTIKTNKTKKTAPKDNSPSVDEPKGTSTAGFLDR